MAYITPEWNYIGMPKTGGHFIRTVLRECFGEQFFNPDTSTYHKMSEEQKELPFILSVRNPWTWYVSHWMWFSHPRNTVGERQTIVPGVTFSDWVKQNPRAMVEEMDFYYLMPPKPAVHKVIRMENMSEDLILALESVGQEVSLSQKDLIRNLPVLNKNPKRVMTYKEHYTPELRDLVLEGAAPVFEAFYPTFEFPKETKDVNAEFSTGL